MDALSRISGLFRHRWDPQIITALDGGPLRYRTLSLNLWTQAGDHCDDGALTRALKRLARGGLVDVSKVRIDGRDFNSYELTAHGRAQLATYRAFLDVYLQLTSGNGQQANGIWPPKQPTPDQPPTLPQDATGWHDQQA